MKIDNLDIKKSFYSSLNERQKRHFLGMEAHELGHGGIQVVSQAFSVSRNRVSRGVQEVKSGKKIPDGRIRKKGGGRKKK
jgi:autotransporter passenger strand-loop-strand repeat protein